MCKAPAHFSCCLQAPCSGTFLPPDLPSHLPTPASSTMLGTNLLIQGLKGWSPRQERQQRYLGTCQRCKLSGPTQIAWIRNPDPHLPPTLGSFRCPWGDADASKVERITALIKHYIHSFNKDLLSTGFPSTGCWGKQIWKTWFLISRSFFPQWCWPLAYGLKYHVYSSSGGKVASPRVVCWATLP